MFGNEFRWEKTKVFNPSGLNLAHFIQTNICFPFRSLAAWKVLFHFLFLYIFLVTFYRKFEWTPALPGKLILGFQKHWNPVFLNVLLKNFLGGMFPEPPRYLAPLALARCLAASKNVTPGAFRNMSAILQNCPVKTLVSVGQRKLVSQPGGWASFLCSFVQSFS